MRKLFLASIIGLLSVVASAQNWTGSNKTINSGDLRFGNGSELSVNNTGNVQQPFYRSSANVWYQLTFSNYPLDYELASGGVGTNSYNRNGSIVQNPTMTNQVFDQSGFTITSGNTGYGTLKVKGNVQVGSDLFEVTFSYYVAAASDNFCKVTTSIKNVGSATATNVRYWVGTRDDYVGVDDWNTKTKGNIVNGVFQQVASAASQSRALQISNGSEAVLFYTTSPLGNMSHSGCCQFTNSTGIDPSSAPISAYNDGSYSMFIRLPDLGVGQTQTFEWYYAAGSLAEIAQVVSQVASASITVNNITTTTAQLNAFSTNTATGSYVVVPTGSTAPNAAEVLAGTSYGSTTVVSSGSGALTAGGNTGLNMSNLNPLTNYTVYFVSQYQSGANTVTSSVTSQDFTTLFACGDLVLRTDGTAGASSCAGVSGTPINSSVSGTGYATAPSTTKTATLRFKWSSATFPAIVPAISSVWINGVSSAMQAGPPSVTTITAGEYFIDYCLYNINLPSTGSYSIRFVNPQTGNEVGICTYSADNPTVPVVTPVLVPNNNPTISSPATVSLPCSGAATSPVNFTVSDVETSLAQLIVSATSSNTTLIPNANLVITQPNASGAGSLSYTVANGQSGSSTITLTVVDVLGGTSTSTFTINVSAGGSSETILVSNSLCGTNTLQWMTMNSITASSATGTGQNGIGVNITQSGAGMLNVNGMYQGIQFPSIYNIPTSGATIANQYAGNFQACFSQPVVNPVVAFSSIGNPGNCVPIVVSQPYSVVWAGQAMTYTSPTEMTGCEGKTIIRLDGTVTCVNFNYLASEFYCTVAFGFENQNCYSPNICSGNSVTLTASGAANYVWSPSTGLNTTSGASVVASPTTTTTYTVTNPSNVCATPASVTVVVNPTPVVTVPANSTVLTGSAMSAQAFTSTVSGTTYTWTNSNTSIGLVGSGSGSVPSFTATNNTSNPVTSTITVTPTSPSLCVGAPITYTITVDPIPNVNVPANVVNCEGSQTIVDFTGTTSNTNYLWTNDNTSIGLAASGTNDLSFTTQNPTNVAQVANVTVTPQAYVTEGYVWGSVNENGTITLDAPVGKIFTSVAFASYGTPSGSAGNYTLGACHAGTSSSVVSDLAIGNSTITVVANNATFGDPCSTFTKALAIKLGYGISAVGTPQTFTITVNPSATIGTSIDTICSGTAFTFAPSSSDIVPANTTYTWSVVNNTNINGASAQAIASATISQTLYNATSVNQTQAYTVTPSSGAAGCVGSPFTYNVTVTPLPTTISAAGSTSFCQGGDVTLIAPVAPIGMSYLYQWKINGVTIPGATSISYIASSSGTYTVTVTNNAGCSATSLGVVVTENPLPTLSANSGSSSVCVGSTATVLNSQVGGVWSSSNLAIATINATSGIVSGVTPGSVTLTYTYTNANGCTSTATSTFTVNSLPTPTITTAGPTTFCQGGSVVLTASAGASYLWSNGATTASVSVNNTQNISVIVTNANGCSAASDITSVVVNALPVATISSLNGNSFCQGSSVTLVASTGSSYLWSTGAITQSVTLSTTQTVTVTITNANGCTSTSAPFSVTMNAAPSAIVTANGPTTFCDGGSVQLSAPLSAAYLWSSGETTQSIQASVDGPYTVTVTDANGCSATSVNTNITVLALPTVQAIAGLNNVCVGSEVALSNATSGGVWSTADASIATITSSGVVTGVSNGQVNLFYTVTNINGCSVAVSLNMTVNANPVLTAINGSSSVCLGSTTTLSNTQVGGVWSSSDVAVATIVANGVVTGLTVGAATISYTYTNAAGCTSSVSQLVTVNALPNATITPNGPTTFCPGGSVTLTATPSMTSYVWSPTGATTASITTGSIGTYTVTVTDANGCTSTSAPTSVNHFALPVASIASSGSTACLGSTVTLTASGGATYAWSNGATSSSIDVTSANDYTVTVTSIDGCSSTATETVIFNANPAVTITANGPTVFCQGGSLTLTASGGTNYVWNNGTIGATATVDQSGSYYVIVTNAAGCTSQSALVNVTVNATPVVAAITGSNSVCVGGNMTLTSATIGGIWTIANNFIATIDGAGNVTGLNAGSTTATYTVTNNGCSSSAIAQINVLNNPVTPVITASGATSVCPGSTVVLFASNAANYQWSTGATTPFVVASQSGSYTVTATGLNGCSATSLPVNVFIGDDTNPIITAPLDVTATPNLGCEAIGVSLGTPVTSDNCGIASVSNNAPAIYPIGTTTVTWTVTDASGNVATATQLVTVVDQTAPSVSAPSNVTATSNSACEATGVQLGMPIATDNCTNDLVITNNAPSIYPLGTTIVTWTVTDAAGNVTTVDQTVTVVDETAPVVLLANTSVVLDANGYATIDFTNVNNGSYDNCGIAAAVLSQSAFDCSNVGENIISVIVTDNNGNETTAQIIITVIASDACGNSNWEGPSVPDAFTPNGNNFNDTWVIPGLVGYNTKEMTVYSRYGTLVHYSSTYNNDWDGTLLNTGTPVPDGTYYYILNLDGGKQLNGYVYINRVKQ
jgi:gliding motility-associated-like protein